MAFGNIEEVQLVFENCEVQNFKFTDILYMYVGDESQRAYRYANGLSIEPVLKKFAIVFKKDTEADFYNGTSLVDRLSERDVTHVVFFGANDKMVSYVIDWGEYDSCNMQYSINQRLQFTPDGHIIFTSSTEDMIRIDAEEIDSFARYM